MALSSIRHAKKDGTTMYSVLSLNILQSLDSHKIDILESIGIKTIADLLNYKYIYQSQILINYAKGLISHDFDFTIYLDNGLQSTPKSDIPNLTLSALKGIGPSLETTWNNEFNIKTLLELSEFAPFIEAKQYLIPDDEVFNEPASAPEDLMPKILGGIHSSVRFSSYVLYEDLIIPLNLLPAPYFGNNFSDIEIAKIFVQEYPLKLSIGYIAGFKQNWINKGTHLGEIIHTLALAPGESRNIATIEWYRRQSSSRSEETIVDEKLSSNLVHSRALNEVTRATAKEIQSGRTDISSSNSTTSEAKSSSLGGGIGASVPIPSTPITADVNINGSIGKSKITSDNTQQGTIITSSSGTRDILGSVMQNINDSTIQNSSNVRSLYSTVVVSDIQQETEQTSTRNVTNYNHMHALNIVSYEVVQKYGIETKMDEFKTLVYLPFNPIKFTFNVITKYWYILKEILKIENPNLFERFDTFIKGGIIREGFSNALDDLEIENLKIITSLNTINPYNAGFPFIVPIGQMMETLLENSTDSVYQSYSTKNGVYELGYKINLEQLDEIKLKINNVPIKQPKNSGDSIDISLNIIAKVKDVTSGENISLSKLYSKTITFQEVFDNKSGNTSIFSITKDIADDLINEINNLTAVNDQFLIDELEGYFNQRKYYFTRILLNNIENELLTDLFRNLILGRDSIDKPFTDYVNPIPIGISDNYLIFETKSLFSNYADNSHLFWQRIEDMVDTDIRKGLEAKITDEVFLPTAGVFAEAILGRANGSEYIDLRRFWNWQDSPIPNNAPSINPITMASRDGGIPDNLDPNQPINTLNIMNPAPFQNPTSLNNALTALQNGNMFRDMSKSEQLASSMQNLSELAKETAKQAGTLSGSARKEALDAAIKMGQQVAKTVDNASKNKAETPTEKGGTLNELDKMVGNKDDKKEDVLGSGNMSIEESKFEQLERDLNKIKDLESAGLMSAADANNLKESSINDSIGNLYRAHTNRANNQLANFNNGLTAGQVNLSWYQNTNYILHDTFNLPISNIYESGNQLKSNRIPVTTLTNNIWYIKEGDYYRKFFVQTEDLSGRGRYYYQKAIFSSKHILPFTLADNNYTGGGGDFVHASGVCTSTIPANIANDVCLAVYFCILEDLNKNYPRVICASDETTAVGPLSNGWIISDIDNPMTEFNCKIEINSADSTIITESSILLVLNNWGYSTWNTKISISTNNTLSPGSFRLKDELEYRIYSFTKLNLNNGF